MEYKWYRFDETYTNNFYVLAKNDIKIFEIEFNHNEWLKPNYSNVWDYKTLYIKINLKSSLKKTFVEEIFRD